MVCQMFCSWTDQSQWKSQAAQYVLGTAHVTNGVTYMESKHTEILHSNRGVEFNES